MTELPEEIRDAASPEEAARLLGAALGLDGPAPLPATERALADPLFARALMSTRKLPALRDRILAEPGGIRVNAAPGTPGAPGAPELPPAPPSSAKLAAKAAGAVLKWGMEGLTHAEPWVIERRLAACAACEHQADAPDTLVYRGVKVVTGKDAKICEICHCLTNTKAAMASEHCPEKDPDNPALSRWGEPWVDPETLPGWPWR
jgi:hypothetical protein